MTATNTTPLDAATVQRCIDALTDRGYTSASIAVQALHSLRPPPEKSEAEKLVDEWIDEDLSPYYAGEREEWVNLAQFILDKQKPAADVKSLLEKYNEAALHWSGSKWVVGATSDKQFLKNDIADRRWFPVETAAPVPASEPQPQYVFGPWIEWQGEKGGECPIPGDWVVQVELDNEWKDTDAEGNAFTDFTLAGDSVTDSRAELFEWDYVSRGCNITHYRVRFEVGKWYDWTGGDCPVLPETLVDVEYQDGKRSAYNPHRACAWSWKYTSNTLDITRFRVVQP